LLHLRQLADISIVQQKRAPTAESTLPAAVALLAFSRRNRSGCENLSLVVTSLSAVPCRHGNTGGIII
jgi:hypothetical protein